MRKNVLLLCLCSLICLLCLTACTVLPPTPGGLGDSTTQEQDTTVKTDVTENPTETETDTQTDTETDTETDISEAETTYGPLHFPESDSE